MNLNLSDVSGMPSTYDYINRYGTNPSMLIILTMVIIAYYLLFSSATASAAESASSSVLGGVPSSGNGGVAFIEIIMWATFILLILLNGVKYFFEIDVVASLNKMFSKEPEIDIQVSLPSQPAPVPEIPLKKQVFHVPNNTYTYDEADAVCKAYGARLASYNEVEDAYKNGGEWCGFGWSADQLALYPTQKATYDKLQKIKGHEHDCGRPGVNGGFIKNKNVRLGINCYGDKPEITQAERRAMERADLYPKTKQDLKIAELVEHYRQKLTGIMVSPFNKSQWSA